MASTILDSLMNTLPLMKKILGLDIQIGLYDREKTIGVWYGDTFRMQMEVGQYLDMNQPGHDMIISALNTGVGNSGILPEFVCGVAVDGIVTPIFDGNEVVGVVSAAVSIKERKEIEGAAEKLNSNLLSSQVIVNDIAKGTSELAERLENMKILSNGIESHIESTSNIIKSIQKNAYKTNLLALNASIEAARAGLSNNGFSVVAKEMGKLANISEESSKTINGLLTEMFKLINTVVCEISTVANISNVQATSMQEIASNLEEITMSATKLEDIATIK